MKLSSRIRLRIRRIHLYSGLFLLPWVIMYGMTGAMFNHLGLFPQPLAAAYDVSVLATVLNLLDQGRQSMRALLEVIRVRHIPVESLRSIDSVDPGLLSLQNMNTPEDFAAAVRPNPK
jgi:molybdopterin-guanine dinucleotide biosynthesis protein A